MVRTEVRNEKGVLIEVQEDGETVWSREDEIRREADRCLKERGLIDEQGRPNVELKDKSKGKALGLGERSRGR